MGIASRLFRVLRSNLESQEPDAPAGNQWQSPEPDPQEPTQAAHPPGQDPQLAEYYSNLEIPYGSNLEVTRSAWKTLVKKYHPDLHGQDKNRRETAEALTQGLNHAYRQIEKHLKNR